MGSLTSDVCVCPMCAWSHGVLCPWHPAWMDSRAGGKAAFGAASSALLDLQQHSPGRRSGHCPSHAPVNVTRTCLQTEAEGWDGQAGAGAGRALLFLVFPSIAQNREGAAPLCCLTVGRNKLDSKNQHSFLGTRSGGHRTPQFPFPLSLLFGLFKLLCKRGWMGGRGSAFLCSPRLNVYDL